MFYGSSYNLFYWKIIGHSKSRTGWVAWTINLWKDDILRQTAVSTDLKVRGGGGGRLQ